MASAAGPSSKSVAPLKNSMRASPPGIDNAPGFKIVPAARPVPPLTCASTAQPLSELKAELRPLIVAQQNLHSSQQDAISNQLEIVQSHQKQFQELEARFAAKLTELQHDANGYQLQADLKKQTWDLKLEGLRQDIDVATRLLQEKRTAANRQFAAV